MRCDRCDQPTVTRVDVVAGNVVDRNGRTVVVEKPQEERWCAPCVESKFGEVTLSEKMEHHYINWRTMLAFSFGFFLTALIVLLF